MRKNKNEFYHDKAKEDRILNFFEKILVHSIGDFYGKPFILEKWQKDFLKELFGTLDRKTKRRRYKESFLLVPRKNGKSTLCAGIALYCLIADSEKMSEVVLAAGSKKQASMVFNAAKNMVQSSPYLKKMIKCYRSELVYVLNGRELGRLTVIPADADTQLGLNISCVIFDELLVQKNFNLYNALKTSQQSRTEPLFISISTAGWGKAGLCWEKYQYTKRVNAGEVYDPTFFGKIYEAEPGQDWRDPKTHKLANPNYGISIIPKNMDDDCRTAQSSPTLENAFKNFHLNLWTAQETRWLNMEKWDACKGLRTTQELKEFLKNKKCYAGMDVGSKIDLTAFCLLFPPQDDDPNYYVLSFPFMPRDTLQTAVERDHVPYDVWEREGYIESIAGERINQDRIIERILELRTMYKFDVIGFDKWNADHIINMLDENGIDSIDLKQGLKLSDSMKDLEAKILSKEIVHGGDPLLRWCADSIDVLQDKYENYQPIKPRRQKDSKRIDPIIALLLANETCNRSEGKGEEGIAIERLLNV